MDVKTLRRRFAGLLLPPLVWGMIQLLWRTCRIQQVIGQEHLDALLASDEPFIPCYWHQQQIFCVRYLLDTAKNKQSLKLGYLISPSADGDMATRMFGDHGVHIIRGSATRGGAQALREIYSVIRKDKVSPIVTPDGPTGPIFQCKPGVAMLAQLSRTPLLPLAYGASSAWHLRSWDKFILPIPFSRIVIGVGPALVVSKEDSVDGFNSVCKRMNDSLNELAIQCQKAAENNSQRVPPGSTTL